MIKDINDLVRYPWSSYPAYIQAKEDQLVERNTVKSLVPIDDKHRQFVEDQADYQRQFMSRSALKSPTPERDAVPQPIKFAFCLSHKT